MTIELCNVPTLSTFIDLKTNELFTYDNSNCETYTDIETIFIIPILEMGWIDDVHLFTDEHCIDAFHIRRGLRYGSKNEIYSFFFAKYTFQHKNESMSAYWSCRINDIKYVTDKKIFRVENFYDECFVKE